MLEIRRPLRTALNFLNMGFSMEDAADLSGIEKKILNDAVENGYLEMLNNVNNKGYYLTNRKEWVSSINKLSKIESIYSYS